MRSRTGPTRRTVLRGGLAAGALAGAGTLLSACGGASGGGGDGKKLTFWNFYSPNPNDKSDPQSKWFADVVAEWNKNNDVTVELRFIPNAEYISGTALKTAFSSGKGPDVFLLSPGDFLRYYNGDVLTDLTPYLSKETIADYRPGVLDTRKVREKIYGLPMESEPLAMFYSVRAFEKAGLSEGDLPKTWDALLDVAERLTTKDRFGVLFDTVPGYYQNFTWYPFMWMGGSDAVKGDASGFNTPGAIKALEFWQNAVGRKVAPKKIRGDGGGDVPANLLAGYSAIQQSGIWSIAQLEQEDEKFEFGVFPLPTPPGGKYTTDLGGWSFVANARGANPEAAGRFIAWALGSADEAGVERGRQWNTVVKTNIPPRTSVQDAADENEAFAKGALKTFVDEVVPGGRGEPRYPAEVYKPVSDAIQACQLGDAQPADAAAEASEKIDAFLKTYDGAPIL